MKALCSEDLLTESKRNKNQHLMRELDKSKHYSKTLARHATLWNEYLASCVYSFAVKKWTTAFWWNMMLLHLSTNSQPKTTLQLDRYATSVEWWPLCACIAGYLTLFHSPERTYNVAGILIYLNLIHCRPRSFRWMKWFKSFDNKASVTFWLWTTDFIHVCVFVCVNGCVRIHLHNSIIMIIMYKYIYSNFIEVKK